MKTNGLTCATVCSLVLVACATTTGQPEVLATDSSTDDQPVLVADDATSHQLLVALRDVFGKLQPGESCWAVFGNEQDLEGSTEVGTHARSARALLTCDHEAVDALIEGREVAIQTVWQDLGARKAEGMLLSFGPRGMTYPAGPSQMFTSPNTPATSLIDLASVDANGALFVLVVPMSVESPTK